MTLVGRYLVLKVAWRQNLFAKISSLEGFEIQLRNFLIRMEIARLLARVRVWVRIFLGQWQEQKAFHVEFWYILHSDSL